MKRVKWNEIVPIGILSTDKLSETTEFKAVEKTGFLVCTHRSFWGRVYAVVQVDGGFREIPLKDLKPAETVYQINDEPDVIQ